MGIAVEFNERERGVIRLICEGLSSKEIGKRMELSPRTIEWYQDGIMVSMGVNNKVGVVLYAIRNGLFVV